MVLVGEFNRPYLRALNLRILGEESITIITIDRVFSLNTEANPHLVIQKQISSMQIILTHEQADFDAIASLLGAHLLDDKKVPVLPRRMNRNVRAFLNLYGVDLNFVDPRDLSGATIEAVTLVDTQSLVSIKGMLAQPDVYVIDHHPLREDLPPEWQITVSGTGANTTLFVETLRERDTMLSMIQATLLLLGVYEDTGSLTYTRTTSRDLRAASYLLDQGASLEIAVDFLNHPLSHDQEILYDYLLKNAKTHHIHGHAVVITCGDAQEMDEELSTVAHKLRDFLDPDALIMLINTRGGVQLVARSTSDNIDVARIAIHFGGGGHERAAASLIKDGDLERICQELISILPDFVQPAVTVAEIMSSSPQLLSPATPVEDAAARMRRYGYEGYPVVDAGRVVGLLTRRAVDRAMTHRLNLPASSLMDAGEVTITPNDSIESLQRLMTETGWGQIPVVHPESGEIIGIVTRTDLLKTLTSTRRFPSHQSMVERLNQTLPALRLALIKLVANTSHEKNLPIYIVGGFVRDMLLQQPSLDFDLVVEGDAILLAKSLARRYGGRVTSHDRFGTAKWYLDHDRLMSVIGERITSLADENSQKAFDLPESLDFVTARIEFYTHPTALPTVEQGNIKLDLHRRDFTINTLALRLDGSHYGKLYDYWGAVADLRQGLIRVLHSLSFIDDPTRILRAVRFERRFDFLIEKRTLELLIEARPLLDRVSGDRIRHELNYILNEARFSSMLTRLETLGILKAIHPALVWNRWQQERVTAIQSNPPGAEWFTQGQRLENTWQREVIYLLWVLPLPVQQAQVVISRLKFSSQFALNLRNANKLWCDLDRIDWHNPGEVVNRLEALHPLILYAVYMATEDCEVRRGIYSFIRVWRGIKPTIDGHDLRAYGLPPGPIYRKILSELRLAWLEGKIRNASEEKTFLKQLLEMD